MAPGVSPVVRRRRLAQELRRLRLAAGRTIEDVARHLECSPGKISQIETAQVSARVQDVREMLDLYGTAQPERDALVELARQSRRKGWWYPYLDVLPREFEIFVGFEDEAATIMTYETSCVPGLVQTEAYARSLLASPRQTGLDEVERRVEFRMARQQVLARPAPPNVALIVDEAVLRRPAGSDAVMREQYNRLIDAAELPHVSIQVLPFAAGPYMLMGLPFTIFGFADPADPQVVNIDLPNRNIYLDKAEDVGVYAAAFAHMRSVALDESESKDFLRHLP